MLVGGVVEELEIGLVALSGRNGVVGNEGRAGTQGWGDQFESVESDMPDVDEEEIDRPFAYSWD